MNRQLLGFGAIKISPGLCKLDKNRPCVVCLILLNYMCDSKLDNICILIYWLKMIEMA